MKTTFAILSLLILASCVNSSTAMAWRSISYQVTPEAGQYVTVDEKQGAATVNAEKTTSDAFKLDDNKENADGK